MDRAAITPETAIEEIVEKHPNLTKILSEHGIVCVVCGEPVWGTLKEAADRKGIKNLEEIIEELNSYIR